jgi:23S rRNA (pseudouridine1915-N3)-methyltransferase
MFKINIIAVGKNKDRWVEEAVEHYLVMLKKYAAISMVYVADVKNSKNLSERELKRLEAINIRKRLSDGHKIALAVEGRRRDSMQFARYLQNLFHKTGQCDFIIGGVRGLDSSIMNLCHDSLSLSEMTFSHRLIRPVLLEQLYRAFSIISGGGYHR